VTDAALGNRNLEISRRQAQEWDEELWPRGCYRVTPQVHPVVKCPVSISPASIRRSGKVHRR
jgi:hypothetical protein